MSRSYRKTPIKDIFCGVRSEKEDKKLWHRKFRRGNKVLVAQGREPRDYREFSDPWCMAKDGTRNWFGNYKYGKKRTSPICGEYTDEELKRWYKEYMRK